MISSGVMEFLTRSAHGIEEIYRPAWLKNEPESNRWHVTFDLEPKPVCKSDRHKRPPAIRINWGLPLHAGDVTSPSYKVLLRQMKLLLLAFVDLGIAPSRTIAQLVHFHKSLMLLATHCDFLSTELTIREGFSFVTSESMLELLVRYQAEGAEGIFDFRDKWDRWIKREVEQVPPDEMLRWETSMAADKGSLLHARRYGVKSLDPNGVAAIPTSVDEGLVRRAKVLLLKRGAFNSNGFISPNFVAQVLGIETGRVTRSGLLMYHLRQYELANDYCLTEFRKFGVRSTLVTGKSTLAEKATDCNGYLTQTLANGLLLVSKSASLVGPLRFSALARTGDLEEALSAFPHKAPARTLSVPLSSGLNMIRCITEWQSRFGKPLLNLLNGICENIPDSKGELTQHLGRLAKEHILVPPNSPLHEFLLSEFWGHAHRCEVATWTGSARRSSSGTDWRKSLSVCDLVEIYTATAFVIVTLFGCFRRQEVLELVDSDLFERNRRWYLKCYLRKKGVDGVRKKIAKPVPNIVAECLKNLNEIRGALLKVTRDRHSSGASRIFFRLTRSAVVNLHTSSLYHMLDMLSEFHGFEIEEGSPWHVRPHQLRRFFALTFFHYGGKENALPALSWFMGHDGEIERTWRYIMEELRGEEISVAEASLAALAVYSDQETAAADTLRRLLLKHFGVDTLDVMDEGEVENYLVHLHSQGQFTARPICVRSAGGDRYDVLIHIKGSFHAASN